MTYFMNFPDNDIVIPPFNSGYTHYDSEESILQNSDFLKEVFVCAD